MDATAAMMPDESEVGETEVGEAGLAVLILGGRDFVPAVTLIAPPQNRSRDDAHLLWLSAGWQVLESNE